LVLATVLFLASGSGAQARLVARGAGNLVGNLCAELLTKPDLTRSVDVDGAPGLRILNTELGGMRPDYNTLLHVNTDAFHPHELVSSARYAKLINEKSGETVLMVPGIQHKSIPGFDGVIFNAKGEPVANFSLKTLLSAQGAHAPIDRASRGGEQAEKFSSIERWFTLAKLLYLDESGHFRVSHELSPDGVRDAKDWLSRSFNIFGITDPTHEKRPTRVVVDIQSDVELPGEADVERARRWVRESNGLIESIIFMKGDDVLEVR
jgi:hypothetical protein